MLQPGSICFRAFFTIVLCDVRTDHPILRIGCATYERSIPFYGWAEQRTNGAFHFADRLSSVRTEHSLLRIGCATYGPTVQSTNEQFCFTNARPRYLFAVRMKSRIFIIAYNSGCLVMFIGGNYKRKNIWLNILLYSKSFQSSLCG